MTFKLYRAARYVHILLCVIARIYFTSYFREVWPEVEFGGSGMSVDEEMDGIRDILLNPAAGDPTTSKHFLECIYHYVLYDTCVSTNSYM